MTRMFYLTYIMIRGNGIANFAGDSGKRQRWLGRIGRTALLVLLALYMLLIMGASSLALYRLLEPAGLQNLLISVYLSAASLLVFFFGVIYVISIFYHSTDVEKLLPLPIPADAIIGAKLMVTLIYEYAFLLVLIIPPLIVYGINSQVEFYYYLYVLAVLIVLPVVPLCVAALLVMLIMRFTPFARNKDRFSLISGLLAMAISLGVVFSSQSVSSFSQEELIRLVQSGGKDLAGMTSALFPGTSWAVAALTANSPLAGLLQLSYLILAAAGFAAVTLLAARLIYFKGVIGLGSSAARRRIMSATEMDRSSRAQPVFWTLVKKDFRILFRTPIFFMNNVLMNFLWPAFIVIPLVSSGSSLPEIRSFFREIPFAQAGSDSALVLTFAFAAACFLSGSNGITESALSREGRLLYFMKIIPVSYTHQLWAKITAGVLLSFSGILLMFILFIIFILPPFWYALIVLLVLPGATVLTNTIGIFFDLFWPKLNWDNEQKAVKQNLNVLLGMMASVFLAGLAVGPVFLFKPSMFVGGGLLIGVPWLLIFFLSKLLRKIGSKQLRNIQA